jgi:hypothetical protein
MAEEQKHTMTLGLDELQAIVAAAVKEAVAATQNSNANIAQALVDARKPYVDPKTIANDKSTRRSMIAAKKKEKEAVAFYQDNVCPHTMGSSESSARSLPDSSFAVHVLDTGEIIGVCTNCQKVISSTKHEDLRWFAVKGGNIRSAAGVRQFADPNKAIRSRLSLDQKELILDELTGELVEDTEPETVPSE